MLITPDVSAPRGPRRRFRGGTIEVAVDADRMSDEPSATTHQAAHRQTVEAGAMTEDSAADFLEVGSNCRLRVLCRICTG
jgi:hypothetical protein